MSLKRKLTAGTAALLIAGAATGAGLAASSHGRSVQPVRHLRLASLKDAAFLRATAQYLGTDVATLRSEKKAGRTLTQIANSTPGRSAKQLTALLVAAASTRLHLIMDRVLPPAQQRVFHNAVRRRVSGFLNDTCPLSLSGFAKHLGGCAGMTA